MYGYVHINAGANRSPKRTSDLLELELPNMGAGN